MQACKEAEKANKVTRIVQRRDLPWEKDSIARADPVYDPEHIPDCKCASYDWKALPLPRSDSKSGKWVGISSSDHKISVVAARTLSKCMDV